MKLNLLDDAIIQLLDDQGSVVFSFELKTLDEYWYGESEEHEYLHVTLGGASNEYVIIIMTTASGQGGIVAVVDIASGEVVHYHDGAFAIFAEIYKDYVITIYGVQQWGVKYYKCVDAVKFGTKEIIEAERQIRIDDNIGDDFTYTISNNAIQLKDRSSGQTSVIEIADLIDG